MAELRLRLAGILDVQPDGSGFLVAGTLPRGGAAVVSMSAVVQERRRWPIPGAGAYAVFTDDAGQHALTREGIIDLGPDGTTGQVRRFPRAPAAGLPQVLTRQGASVICLPTSLTMAHRAHGTCERSGAAGWKFEGDFLEPPLLCGGSVIVTSVGTSTGPGLRPGSRAQEILSLSWDTGKVQGRARSAVPPALACADPEALLIGDRQLRLLRLPSLKAAWTQAVGSRSVRDVATTKSFIAYQLDESLDVIVLPRPGSSR